MKSWQGPDAQGANSAASNGGDAGTDDTAASSQPGRPAGGNAGGASSAASAEEGGVSGVHRRGRVGFHEVRAVAPTRPIQRSWMAIPRSLCSAAIRPGTLSPRERCLRVIEKESAGQIFCLALDQCSTLERPPPDRARRVLRPCRCVANRVQRKAWPATLALARAIELTLCTSSSTAVSKSGCSAKARSSPGSAPRAPANTRAPRSTNASASAAPKPREAPAMRTRGDMVARPYRQMRSASRGASVE
jgi:hypothetical protein